MSRSLLSAALSPRPPEMVIGQSITFIKDRTALLLQQFGFCEHLCRDYSRSVVIGLHDVSGVGVVSSSGECNYPDIC